MDPQSSAGRFDMKCCEHRGARDVKETSADAQVMCGRMADLYWVVLAIISVEASMLQDRFFMICAGSI